MDETIFENIKPNQLIASSYIIAAVSISATLHLEYYFLPHMNKQPPARCIARHSAN